MAPRTQVRTRWSLVMQAIAGGLGAVYLSGCGSTSGTSAVGPRADPSPSRGVVGFLVTYRLASTGGGEQNFDKLEVLTDGRAKVRETIGVFGAKAEVARLVTDGLRAVAFTADGNGGYGAGSKYQQLKVSEFPRFVLRDGGRALDAWCADAKVVGTAEVLGRSTQHYGCRDPGIEKLEQAKDLWVDQQTGLILKWTKGSGGNNVMSATATRVDLHANLPTDAFSTQRPARAQDAASVFPTGFRLARVGGGELNVDTTRPVILVIGRPDDIRTLVARLLPLTGGGKSPMVVGLLVPAIPADRPGSLLNPSDSAALAKTVSASAGTFQVPVGIDFKGNVSGQADGTRELGSQKAAVVLMNSHGKLSHVAPPSTSDSELRSWIDKLT